MAALALDLEGTTAMAVSSVGKSERLTLGARCGKAAPALDIAHLKAATSTATLDIGLETASAATTVFDAECPSATATAATDLGVAAATAALRRDRVAIAITATLATARLGARRHRNRQSGDTSGKKQPGHQNFSFNALKRAERRHVPPLAELRTHSDALA
jgi:hypothetical protein